MPAVSSFNFYQSPHCDGTAGCSSGLTIAAFGDWGARRRTSGTHPHAGSDIVVLGTVSYDSFLLVCRRNSHTRAPWRSRVIFAHPVLPVFSEDKLLVWNCPLITMLSSDSRSEVLFGSYWTFLNPQDWWFWLSEISIFLLKNLVQKSLG